MSHHAPLVIDIAGHTLTATDRRRLRHPLTGGLILFGRNWQSRAQLTELCADIHRVRPDVLIAVDHEGGRVQRFRSDGFTHLPPMRALGELWMLDAMRAQHAARAAGYVLAAELRACGVDFSFTPVLDLDWCDTDTTGASRSRVIGDRAFHADARVVSTLAMNLLHGLQQAGMGNCGKHFPGHGFVVADSHVDVPIDRRSLKAILADDAKPYAWLPDALTAVMPAHVIYPKVDARPAGFSSRWLNDILRGQLGFDGAIFSDDLSMAGARVLEGRALNYTEATLAALQAGCDLALLCNQSVDGSTVIDEVLDGLAEAQVKGQWTPNEASARRRMALLPTTPALTWNELMREPRYLQALDALP